MVKVSIWGPRNSEKIWGPTVSLRGPSQPAHNFSGCVGPGNPRQQFLGARERRSPAFPLTLTTACVIMRGIWPELVHCFRKVHLAGYGSVHICLNKEWNLLASMMHYTWPKFDQK